MNAQEVRVAVKDFHYPPPNLTWKLIEGPILRIVVWLGAPLHFHVDLGECKLL